VLAPAQPQAAKKASPRCGHRCADRTWASAPGPPNSPLGFTTNFRCRTSGPTARKSANRIRKCASFTTKSCWTDHQSQGGTADVVIKRVGDQTPNVHDLYTEAQKLPEGERAAFIAAKKAELGVPQSYGAFTAENYKVDLLYAGDEYKVRVTLKAADVYYFDDPSSVASGDRVIGVDRTIREHAAAHVTVR